MRRLHGAAAALAAIISLGAWACGGGDGSTGGREFDGPGVDVTVTPVDWGPVVDASYDVVVTADGVTVWERAGVTSAERGDGAGGVSYLAACDPGAALNTVTVTLVSLTDADGQPIPASTWRNPTPVSVDFTCVAGQDAAVDVHLGLIRDAEPGFFDVAVTWGGPVCSARVDCVDGAGAPLERLVDPASGAPGQSLVLTLACTSGPGLDTYLHLTDVALECDGGERYVVTSGDGPGVLGGQEPGLFQTAVARGREQLAGGERCAWDVTLGLDLGPGGLGDDCRLVGLGTATEGPLASGRTPEDTRWPVVSFDVPVTGADGSLACGSHLLGAADGAASATYSPLGGSAFAHALECKAAPLPSGGSQVLCGDGLVGAEEVVSVTTSTEGMTFAIGARRSEVYALPEGLGVEGCCPNPCCSDGGLGGE